MEFFNCESKRKGIEDNLRATNLRAITVVNKFADLMMGENSQHRNRNHVHSALQSESRFKDHWERLIPDRYKFDRRRIETV